MHIYRILKKQDGDYNLVWEDIILEPTEKDWDEWENSPDSKNNSRWQAEKSGNYFMVADVDDLANRKVEEAEQIIKEELFRKGGNEIITVD